MKIVYLSGNLFCVETPDGNRTRPGMYQGMLSFTYKGQEYWAITPYYGGDKGEIVKVEPVESIDVDES